MKLGDLVSSIADRRVTGSLEPDILSLVLDSRKVRPRSLFFALPGSVTDGNRYVKQAVNAGATAIVSELALPPAPYSLIVPDGSNKPVTWIEVPNAAVAMSRISAAFYRRPSSNLTVVGITGTNGKTTTAYMLESILHHAGHPCGVFGTINYRIRGREVEKAPNTTPSSLDLQRLMAQMLNEGCSHAVTEVSSHALALHRVDDIDFDSAVMTNLHRDHLDFHKTRENYFEAKAGLFDLLSSLQNPKKRKVAVINHDDETFVPLKRRIQGPEIISFGLDLQADCRATDMVTSLNGTMFRLLYKGSAWAVRLALIGRHNVYNALAASAVGFGLGLPADKILEGLAALKNVPGRLEPVGTGRPFHVFIDYAHTDSALQNALEAIRRLPHKRILTVFGCGGDRDRTKRGPMGVAACGLSDQAFVTSDNPRNEDPQQILADIEAGIKTAGCQNYKMLPDRADAIRQAVQEAREGDVVLIAGKGHETTQIIRDQVLHFDDREEALKALQTIPGFRHPGESRGPDAQASDLLDSGFRRNDDPRKRRT